MPIDWSRSLRYREIIDAFLKGESRSLSPETRNHCSTNSRELRRVCCAIIHVIALNADAFTSRTIFARTHRSAPHLSRHCTSFFRFSLSNRSSSTSVAISVRGYQSRISLAPSLSLPIAPNCVSRHANSLLVALLLLAYCNSIRTETPTTATTDARERFLPTTIYLLVYLLLLILSACTCNDAASISVFFRSMRKFEESIDRGGHAEGTIRLGRSLNDKARAKDKISRANWRQRAAESAREFAARHCRPTVR